MAPFKSLPLLLFIITIFLEICSSSQITPAAVIRKRIKDSTAVNVSKFVVEQYMYNSPYTPHSEDQWISIEDLEDPGVVQFAKYAVSASNLGLSFLKVQRGSSLWTDEKHFLKFDIEVLKQVPRHTIEMKSTYRAEMYVANGFQQLTDFIEINDDHQNSANHLTPAWTPIAELKSPDVVGYAKFAIDKYNEHNIKKFVLKQINSGSTRMSDGKLYVQLDINVKNLKTRYISNYRVELYCLGGPNGQKHLTSFIDPLEGTNWIRMPTQTPDSFRYANFAVSEYNRRNNRHLVSHIINHGKTRMNNGLFQVQFDITVFDITNSRDGHHSYRVKLHCLGGPNGEKYLDEFNPLEEGSSSRSNG